jgi:hypothetical protein
MITYKSFRGRIGKTLEENIGVHLRSQFEDESHDDGKQIMHLDDQAISALAVQSEISQDSLVLLMMGLLIVLLEVKI